MGMTELEQAVFDLRVAVRLMRWRRHRLERMRAEMLALEAEIGYSGGSPPRDFTQEIANFATSKVDRAYITGTKAFRQ